MAAMSMPPDPPVLTALAECGLSRAGLTLEFDEVLQGVVVTVSRKAGTTASMFPCIRGVIRLAGVITFEDEQLNAAYLAFQHAAYKEESRASARAWLAERGLLDKVPIFSEGEKPDEIAARIERFCGLTPGSALEFHSPTFLTLKREFLASSAQLEFACLMHTMMFVDLDKYGLRFGFIGNGPAEDTEH